MHMDFYGFVAGGFNILIFFLFIIELLERGKMSYNGTVAECLIRNS